MIVEQERLLVERARRGDRDAFEDIVRTHEKMVYSLALRTLGSREDAEDVAQEVFLKAYTSLGAFRGESRLSVWLCSITRNACTDALRRRKETVSLFADDEDGEGARELEIADERFDPARCAEQSELREQLSSALGKLPDEFREVLLLRESAGRSYEEIAEALGLDLGTVKSRIFRARKKLCALLSENGNFFAAAASKKMKGGDGA